MDASQLQICATKANVNASNHHASGQWSGAFQISNTRKRTKAHDRPRARASFFPGNSDQNSIIRSSITQKGQSVGNWEVAPPNGKAAAKALRSRMCVPRQRQGTKTRENNDGQKTNLTERMSPVYQTDTMSENKQQTPATGGANARPSRLLQPSCNSGTPSDDGIGTLFHSILTLLPRSHHTRYLLQYFLQQYLEHKHPTSKNRTQQATRLSSTEGKHPDSPVGSQRPTSTHEKVIGASTIETERSAAGVGSGEKA